jgi:hypothetical protein
LLFVAVVPRYIPLHDAFSSNKPYMLLIYTATYQFLLLKSHREIAKHVSFTRHLQRQINLSRRNEFFAERIGRAVMIYTRIRNVLGLNLARDTSYAD